MNDNLDLNTVSNGDIYNSEVSEDVNNLDPNNNTTIYVTENADMTDVIDILNNIYTSIIDTSSETVSLLDKPINQYSASEIYCFGCFMLLTFYTLIHLLNVRR